MRVLARDHDEVDDGWLCDKGRFAYQSIHVDERIIAAARARGRRADAGELGEGARRRRERAARRPAARPPRWPAARPPTRRRSCSRGCSARASAPAHLAARAGGELPLDVARALADPALQATVPDLEFAHAVLVLDCDPVDDAPILDLRIRKGVRRHGVRLAVASARPGRARPERRGRRCATRPAAARRCSSALDAALGRRRRQPRRRGQRGRLERRRPCASSPSCLDGAGEDVVIVYGERLLAGPRGDRAAQALLNLAARLGPRRPRRRRACSRSRRRPTAAACARPASPPAHGPGYATLAEPGRDATGIAARARRRRPRRRSTCCTPTRCARIPDRAALGGGAAAPRRP